MFLSFYRRNRREPPRHHRRPIALGSVGTTGTIGRADGASRPQPPEPSPRSPLPAAKAAAVASASTVATAIAIVAVAAWTCLSSAAAATTAVAVEFGSCCTGVGPKRPGPRRPCSAEWPYQRREGTQPRSPGVRPGVASGDPRRNASRKICSECATPNLM